MIRRSAATTFLWTPSVVCVFAVASTLHGQRNPLLERYERERFQIERERERAGGEEVRTRESRLEQVEQARYNSAADAWEAVRRLERRQGISTSWRGGLWERVAEPEVRRYAESEARRLALSENQLLGASDPLNSPNAWLTRSQQQREQIAGSFRTGTVPRGTWIEGEYNQALYRFQLAKDPIGTYWTRWDPRPLLERYQRGEVTLREVSDVVREFTAVRLDWSNTRSGSRFELQIMEIPRGSRLFAYEGETSPVERTSDGSIMLRAGAMPQVVVLDAKDVPRERISRIRLDAYQR